MPTITEAVSMVRDFHVLIDRDVTLTVADLAPSDYLRQVGEKLVSFSELLLEAHKQGVIKDERGLRSHLCVEELGEFIIAMADCDEEKTLDAAGDLLYVLFGSALTMDLPLEAAFVEIHRSNMTKRRQSTDPDACRVRDKGSSYVPPDLASILRAHRDGQQQHEAEPAEPLSPV